MGAGVGKLHHPCFSVFFDYYRACGDFQIHSGFFYPFGFGDTFFAPCVCFWVLLHGGIHQNNMPVLSSSFCRCRIENRTIDIGWEAVATSGMPPALQTAGRCSRKEVLFGASGCLRQLLHKARRCHFGLFHLSVRKGCRSSANTQAIQFMITRREHLSTGVWNDRRVESKEWYGFLNSLGIRWNYMGNKTGNIIKSKT